MKKAIFFPPSCSNTKLNEFESCRGEGRAIFNIAFGFSLLGYECHIINNWNLTTPQKIWDNVYIRNHIDHNETYNIAFTYDAVSSLNSKNYIHRLVMTYEPSNIEKIRKYIKDNKMENTTLICTHESVKKTNHYSLKYFPALYPIPSVNIGFIPYKYEPKLPEIKIYVYHSSWGGSATSNFGCRSKQVLILNFLKSKGYKLNLYIHIESDRYINNNDINPFISYNNTDKVQYVNNEKICYDDIIRTFKEVDLCISFGGLNYPGSSVLDMLSLGKPLISVVDGVNVDNKGKTFEPFNMLYRCSNNLIMIQETAEVSINKLERIFSGNNLEQSYNCYKKCYDDFDFNNWKLYTEKFLKEIGEQ